MKWLVELTWNSPFTSPSVSVASRQNTLPQRPLRDLCSFVFGSTSLRQQPLHCDCGNSPILDFSVVLCQNHHFSYICIPYYVILLFRIASHTVTLKYFILLHIAYPEHLSKNENFAGSKGVHFLVHLRSIYIVFYSIVIAKMKIYWVDFSIDAPIA